MLWSLLTNFTKFDLVQVEDADIHRLLSYNF